MPLYRCFAPAGAITAEQRQAVAEAITDIHCDETTAPPTFVHVQFQDATDRQSTAYAIHGGLRAGRPKDVTERIVKRATEAVAAIVGVGPDDISMRTSETPASWIYEGGRVMPEPGDEDSWVAST